MTQKLHENIAAIATNLATDMCFINTSYDVIHEVTWAQMMTEVVEFAKAFTEVESTVQDAYDYWYDAIDSYTEQVAQSVINNECYPSQAELTEMAKSAFQSAHEVAHAHG